MTGEFERLADTLADLGSIGLHWMESTQQLLDWVELPHSFQDKLYRFSQSQKKTEQLGLRLKNSANTSVALLTFLRENGTIDRKRILSGLFDGVVFGEA